MKEKPSGRVGKRRPAINVPKRSKQRVAGVGREPSARDRKSTRLNSSHGYISYAVFCLKKKNTGLLASIPNGGLTVVAIPRRVLTQAGSAVGDTHRNSSDLSLRSVCEARRKGHTRRREP